MKKPLLWLSSAFIFGAFLGIIIPDGIAVRFLSIVLTAAALKLLMFKNPASLLPVFHVLILTTVFSVGLLYAENIRSAKLYAVAPLSGEYAAVEGMVVDIETATGSVMLTLKTAALSSGGVAYELKTKVNVVVFGEIPPVSLGDTLRAEGTLTLYEPMKFWGDTGSRAYYASDGIFAHLSAKPDKLEVIRPNPMPYRPMVLAQNARDYIASVIARGLSGDEAALLTGIVIGGSSNFSDELKDAFRLSGLTHIVSVSGLHISIFILFISFGAWSICTNRRLVSALVIAAIAAYALIADAQPSILRAGMMAVYGIIMENLKLRRDTNTALMASTALLALYNPYLLHNTGFQLSFLATLGIILLAGKIIRYKIANAGFAAFIFTLPLLAYSFNTVTFAALITNILVSPLVILLLLLGLLMCAVPYLWVLLSPILFSILHVMIVAAKFFASIKWLTLGVTSPNIYMLICCVILLYLLYRTVTKRLTLTKTAWILAVSLLFATPGVSEALQRTGNAEMTFIAAKNGDAVHIKTPNGYHVLVGGGYGPDVRKYLRSKNIEKIDAVILTNRSAEDTAGILNLFEKGVPITRMYVPLHTNTGLFKYPDGSSAETLTYYQGDSFSIDGAAFDVLLHDQDAQSVSGSEAVIRMRCLGGTALFLGANGPAHTQQMISRHTDSAFVCDILRLGGHGSADANSADLLLRTHAKYAVANAGYNQNRRLDPEVRRILAAEGALPLETYVYGSIGFIIGKDGVRSVTKTRIPLPFETD